MGNTPTMCSGPYSGGGGDRTTIANADAGRRQSSMSSFVDVTACVRPRSPRRRRRRPRRGAREIHRARVCVRIRLYMCVRASWMNEPPVTLGRSSRPFNRSPLVNRWPGGQPTVARVGARRAALTLAAAAASAAVAAAARSTVET